MVTSLSTPFKEDELCSRSKSNSKSLFKEFYMKPFPPTFIKRAREFMGESSISSEYESCRKFLPYRAEVTFRLATDTVSVTVRSRRLSFFDKLSGVGNVSPSSLVMKILSLQEEYWDSSLG